MDIFSQVYYYPFGLARGRVPRVVGADAPEVAFEVATGEGAAAVVHLADVEDHLGSGGFGGGVDGVGVFDDEVRAFGLAEADLVGLGHELAEVAAIVDGAEHDHAVSEGELGVGDGVVGAEMDCVLLEAEGADEPIDGSEGVEVAEAGNDGGAAGFGLVAHKGMILQRRGVVLEKTEVGWIFVGFLRLRVSRTRSHRCRLLES
jgi:hypothetical protein